MAKIMPLASADLDVVTSGPATDDKVNVPALFLICMCHDMHTWPTGRQDACAAGPFVPSSSARAGMRNVGDRPENQP